jgi:transcriptional regulatory protein RtcR
MSIGTQQSPATDSATSSADLPRSPDPNLDLFDRAQLAFVVGVCRACATLSEAGRKLFGATRARRKVQNDADRLRKYLARFDLDWQACRR